MKSVVDESTCWEPSAGKRNRGGRAIDDDTTGRRGVTEEDGARATKKQCASTTIRVKSLAGVAKEDDDVLLDHVFVDALRTHTKVCIVLFERAMQKVPLEEDLATCADCMALLLRVLPRPVASLYPQLAGALASALMLEQATLYKGLPVLCKSLMKDPPVPGSPRDCAISLQSMFSLMKHFVAGAAPGYRRKVNPIIDDMVRLCAEGFSEAGPIEEAK